MSQVSLQFCNHHAFTAIPLIYVACAMPDCQSRACLPASDFLAPPFDLNLEHCIFSTWVFFSIIVSIASTMINAKRRRESAATRTSIASQTDGKQTSSAALTSPLHHSQASRLLPLVPNKRVNLQTPNAGRTFAPKASSTYAAARSYRQTSTGPSEADLRPENDADIGEREDADSLNEVIMAVDMKDKGNVGCCYYVARDEKLALLSDVQSGGLEIIDARVYCVEKFRCWDSADHS